MKKNIVFMGTPEYATTVLKALSENFNICAIFTQPDKPVGRKQILTPPDVKKWALLNGFENKIYQPTTLKDETVFSQILAIKPDFIVVAAYGMILPKSILDIAPCINLHASILPKFRGASPIQSAILSNEKIHGVSAMRMDVGLDDGDMLGFSCFKDENFRCDELFDKLAFSAAKLCVKVIQNFDYIQPVSQIDGISSKCKKIKKEHGKINFSDNADEIWAKFKAFYGWPGIFTQNGTKILDMKISPSTKEEIFGNIVEICKNSFKVSAKGGNIEIFELQEISKKPLKAGDYINGKRLKVGDKFY